MDPFDEFEFKPLTEGLGFHRKETKLESVATDTSSPPVKKSLLKETLFKNKSMDLMEEEDVNFTQPLPRRSTKVEQPKVNATSVAVEEILKNLQQTPVKNTATISRTTTTAVSTPTQEKNSTAKKTASATQKASGYAMDTISFSAFLLDALLILAFGLLCMILMLSITKVDLLANWARPDKQGFIYFSTFSVFATVAFIYYIVNRAFLGYTPGEWAYDQRLGTPEDMQSLWYIPKCLARWFIIFATGIFIVPMVSKIIEEDFVGKWLGIPLMRKK